MSDRFTYRNLPVRYKLRLVIMATVTAALLGAGGAVLAYDRLAARNSLRNHLEILAEMVSANSTAALSFDDAPRGPGAFLDVNVRPQLLTAALKRAGVQQARRARGPHASKA